MRSNEEAPAGDQAGTGQRSKAGARQERITKGGHWPPSSHQSKEAIKEAVNLVGWIGRDVELREQGAQFVGLCPFHAEKSGSFLVHPDKQTYYCHGCKAGGDIFKWLEKFGGMSFREALEHLSEVTRIPLDESPPKRRAQKSKPLDPASYETPAEDPKPNRAPEWLRDLAADGPSNPRPGRRERDLDAPSFDWAACVAAMRDAQVEQIATERGYRVEFVEFLRREKLVGWFRGDIAFPVMDEGGEVVACHYRTAPHKAGGKNGWAYPKGATPTPLVIGDLKEGGHVTVHESQWDALAMADALGYDEDPRGLAFIITRGATANFDAGAFALPQLIAIPQNDPDEKRNDQGLTPADQWLANVTDTRSEGTRLLVSRTPDGIKDVNDWTRAGACPADVRSRLIEGARSPLLQGALSGDDLCARWEAAAGDFPDCLIGTERRFISKGGSFLFIGPSGIGKSTLMTNMAAHWAAGRPWHGINVRRPLKILFIQAENDADDLAEMFSEAVRGIERDLGAEAAQLARRNMLFCSESTKTGEAWCKWLEGMIRETGADLVIADPLLSYFGDDISSQKACSIFFRNHLQPVLHRSGAIVGFCHHTGKTSADAKARSHWSASDYSYIGIGSSELTNWPRAIMTLLPANKDSTVFKFAIAKRGTRSGLESDINEEQTTSLFLAHATEGGLGWTEVEEPAPEPAGKRGARRKLEVQHVVDRMPLEGSIEKAELIALFDEKVCKKTVTARINEGMRQGEIHVAGTGERPGGGRPLTYLARGPDPVSDQSERSL